MRIPYRYLSEDRDRHGNRRIYFRHGGRKVRIREMPGTAAFQARYDTLFAAAMGGTLPARPSRRPGPMPGTLGWLAAAYEASQAFGGYDPSTQRTRRRLMALMLAEPVAPDAAETFADFPLARIKTAALEVLRDRQRDMKGSANDRVKALRALFRWAAEARHVPANPALGLAKLRVTTSGHHTWTLDEIAQFEARHPAGSRAHLALRLMLYTGARRSDAPRLGRQHVRHSVIRWTAFKNRNRHPTVIEIPLLPPLAEAIAAAEAAGNVGDMVFLRSEHGRPFVIESFGNWFKDQCRAAGLPHCSAHGLRKAGSTCAAEAGATAHQLMAMFGWRSLAEAERYTRSAERRRMAAAGMGHLLDGLTRPRNAPPSQSSES